MIPRFLAAANVAVAVAVAAPALAAPLEITSAVMVQQRVSAADGTTSMVLVKPARVVPGDRVIFVLTYRNTGTQPITDVVLANPIPAGIAYRAAAEGSPAPDLSTDGKTFGALASLRVRGADGSLHAAGLDDVAAVRWRIAATIRPGATGRLAFAAVVQ